MQELLSKTEPQSASINFNSDGPRSLDQESVKVLSQKLFNISGLIVKEAQSWVDRVLVTEPGWSQLDRIMLKGVFKTSLQVDPSIRLGNVSRLPLVHGKRYVMEVSRSYARNMVKH